LPELAVDGGSVSQVLAEATAALTDAGCDTPRLDAEILLAFVLGVDRGRLVIDSGASVGGATLERFVELVGRRAAREPVAYIVGRKGFRWIELEVDRRVLIPRPETELLVEIALSLPSGARVVDVGTGSGAVALSLATERPDLSVTATDVSAEALVVARANAARLGLADSVTFFEADLLEGVPGEFDAVLANLPYVPEQSDLPPEIGVYEPAAALFGGPDGLDLVRRLLPMVVGVPLVALEVGLAEWAAWLARDAGFESVEIVRDLAGLERVVVVRQ
jgi:release factor glutamine methyltransferase